MTELDGSATTFTYDATGNHLSSMTEGGTTTNYVYNALGQLLCTTTGTDYSFDARDRLVGVDDGTGDLAYAYDAGGRRISQDLNGTVTHYRWDEFSPYGDIVYETDGTQTTSYVLANGHLISQTQDATTSYYLADAQGSTRALTDSSGAILNTYDYAAFGDLVAQTGTTSNDYLYTGQRFDATNEQYYLRAREYDPVVGRFLSRDTWAVDTWNPVELNRYVYAAANPVTWSDPSGYSLVEVGTINTQVSAADVLVLTIMGWALTCMYYYSYMHILQAAGLDITVIKALTEAGCEPRRPPKDDGKKCQGRNCDDGNEDKITLYHYTLPMNIESILENGLKPSLDKIKDAAFGYGQYFTDLTPMEVAQFTAAEVSKAFFARDYKWGRPEEIQGIVWIAFRFPRNQVRCTQDLYDSQPRIAYPNRGIWIREGIDVLSIESMTGFGITVFQPMLGNDR